MRRAALPLVLVSLLSSSAWAEDAREAPEAPRDDAQAAPAAVEVREKLLVLGLVDRGAGEELTRALSEALFAQAARSSRDVVVTAAALKQALDADALANLSGCDGDACMKDLASEVDADRVLGGSVGLAAGDAVISLVIVEAGTGARVGEAQRKVSAHPALASYATRAMTAALLGSPSLGEPVPVLVESEPPGARVLVGEELLGSAPVVVPLSVGTHELRVRADGYDEQRLGVSVVEGAPVTVRAALTRPPVRLWPIAAGLGGAALLSGTGATLAGISAGNAYDGSYGFFTPDEDVARSYRHASPVDSTGLASKRQQVEQLALVANSLWVVTATLVAATVVVGAVDVGLWATSE